MRLTRLSQFFLVLIAAFLTWVVIRPWVLPLFSNASRAIQRTSAPEILGLLIVALLASRIRDK